MKKLGKTLVVISLITLIVDYIWGHFWGLRIEPAGNPIQLLYLALPYQFNRIFSYLVHAFTQYRMDLFWLGFALWFVSRKEKE